MINKLWLIMISILIISCQNEQIDYKFLIGSFDSIENSDGNYYYLKLKEDKTFELVRAISVPCKAWGGKEYGSWQIENNKLVLKKGVQLDSLISIQKKKNLSTDTLKIKFTNSFLNEFPYIKVTIGFDTLRIIDNQIILDKAKYSLENKLFQFSNEDKETNYDREPLKVVLKEDGFFQETEFILSYEEIKYDLSNFRKDKIIKENYFEYRKKNGILISDSTGNNHKLKKRKLKE